jgi:hypothetical protein
MNIQNISVHIRYSKPLTGGSYKTVELAAEGTIAPDEDYHQAQVSLYHALGETMKYVFSGNGSGKPQNGLEQTAPPSVEPQRPDHYCHQHNMPFKRYEKDGKSWWSHRQRNSWCRES